MKFIRFFEGFFLGGLIGAAAALLLAPETGDELRQQVRSEINRFTNEVQSAAGTRRAELEEQLAALRSPNKSA